MDDAAVRDYIEFIIRLKLNELNRGLHAADQDIAAFARKGKQHLDNTGKSFDELDARGKKISTTLAASLKQVEGALDSLATKSGVALGAMAAAGALAVKAYGDLEAKANTLQAISGATAAEMDQLNAKAVQLGESSKYTSTQVHEANTELARLGFTSAEIADAIDGVVVAAAASGEGLSLAGELIAGTVRGFNLAASDASYVADVMAKAANVSALSFHDLQNSMKYVAPVASSANQSLEDMASILGVLSNNMIKGEQGGTSTRSMLNSLINPGKEAKETLAALGVTMEDVKTGKLKPLKQIFSELQVAMKDYKDIAKGQMLGDIFGQEAISAAQVLLRTANDELVDMRDNFKDVAGESDRTAAIMSKGINYELDQLKAKVETAAIKFGKELAPALEKAIKYLQELVDWFSNLPDPIKKTITDIGLLALGITAFGGAVALAGKGVLGLIGLLGRLGSAAAGLEFLGGLVGLAGGGPVGALALLGTAAVVGTGIYAQNVADHVNATEQTNSDTVIAPDSNTGWIKALAKARRAPDKTTADELRDAARQAKQEALTLQNQLAPIRGLVGELAVIEDEIASYADKPFASVPTNLKNRQAEILEAIRFTGATTSKELKGAVVQLNHDLGNLHNESDKFHKLAEKKAADAKKIKADPSGTGKDKPLTESEKAAAERERERKEREANQKQLKGVDEFFGKMTSKREGLRLQWEKSAAQMMSADAKVSTEFGSKLATAADHISVKVMGTTKRCMEGVNRAFLEATGQVLVYAESAYMAADKLAKDARFTEAHWDQKSTLPAGAVVVWGKGTSKHGHISIADGQGNEMSDHKSRQMRSHYGGAKPRVFLPKGAAMAGVDSNLQKDIQNQQILTQLQQQYTQDIAAAVAYRDKLTQGSDAWKKADEEIIKMRHEAEKIGIDLLNNQRELEKKLAEDRRKWAAEQLDIESSNAEARAAMTINALDDIKAAHLRTMNDLKKAEAERLAQEGTTQEQRQAVQEQYRLKRLAAEKQLGKQLLDYYKAQTEEVRAAEQAAEKHRIDMMEEGLAKRLALIEFERQTAIEEIDKRRDKLRELQAEERKNTPHYEADGLNTGMGVYYNTVRGLGDPRKKRLDDEEKQVNERAQKAADAAKRAQKNVEALQAIQDKFKDIDLDVSQRQLGVSNPAELDRLNLEANKQKLQVQMDITAELERQRKEVGAGADDAIRLDKELADSHRASLNLQIEGQKIILQGLERERAARQEILGILSQIISRSGHLGQLLSGPLNTLLNAKDTNGQQVDWLGMIGSSESALPLKPGGRMASAGAAASNGAVGADSIISTDASSAAAAGLSTASIIAIAAQLKETLDTAMQTSVAEIRSVFWGDPEQLQRAADDHKLKMLDLDLQIHNARIQAMKARGQDTLAAEFEMGEKQLKLSLAQIDKEVNAAKEKRTGFASVLDFFAGANGANPFKQETLRALKSIGIQPVQTKEEQQAAEQAEKEGYEKREKAYQDFRDYMEQKEREHQQKRLDIIRETSDQLLQAQLNAQQQAAALTGDNEDDIEAERARRRLQAWETWTQRMAAIQKKKDETGVWDSEAEAAANHEKAITWQTIEHDLAMKGLNEEQRIRQVVSSANEEAIKRRLKGLEEEIALIEEKANLEAWAIETKLQDPSLDPRERQALIDQKENLKQNMGEQKRLAIQKSDDALRLAPYELSLEKAKGTKTQGDDLIAEYKLQLEKFSQAERDVREQYEGQILTNNLAKIAQQRLNAEQQLAKQLKEVWAAEYKERLEQQKTLIQEQLELDSRGLQDSIAEIERAMRPLQQELQTLQRQLDESQRKRDAEKRVYKPGDGVRNAQWAADLAALDATEYTQAGIDAIANTDTHKSPADVSGATQYEGLLKEAELQEMAAYRDVTQEDITEEEFKKRMQKVALLRARAAEMELATEGLKRERKLELEKEWAEAYAAWQQYATEAIDARYDAEEQNIQDAMNLKQQEIQQQQDRIEELQRQITELSEAAQPKIRMIDDEIKRVTQSTRDWAPQWTNVAKGINDAKTASDKLWEKMQADIKNSRLEMEKLIATTQQLPGSDTAGELNLAYGRSKTKDKAFDVNGVKGTYSIAGTGGWYYATSSDMYKGDAYEENKVKSSASSSSGGSGGGGGTWRPGLQDGGYNDYDANGNTRTTNPAYMADGGFIPDQGQYANDRFGPVYLNRGEAVVPFSKWPEILRPFMQQARPVQHVAFSPQISISGNHIVGEFDMYQTAYRAAADLVRENNHIFADNAGRLF